MIFNKETCQPDFESWNEILKENRTIIDQQNFPWTASERQMLRQAVIKKALSFTENLDLEISRRLKIEFKSFDSGDFNNCSSSFVLASGHQPIIYHSGILYKNYLISRHVKNNKNAIGLNIIIDTDVGDSGKLAVVKKGVYGLERANFHLAEKDRLFNSTNLKDAAEIAAVFDELTQALAGFTGVDNRSIEIYKKLYQDFEGTSVVEANTAIRRYYEGKAKYIEIPLSEILVLPEIQSYICKLFKDYKKLFWTYNETLDAFRLEHKIKNVANPFPNLILKGNRIEMPFWLIDRKSSTREIIWLESSENNLLVYSEEKLVAKGNVEEISKVLETLQLDYQVVPKASFITQILRLGISDLFIHGLGGAKYDEFTDRFIKLYASRNVPSFCTASASRFLLEKEISKYELEKSEHEKRRDMRFHIKNYLADSVFDQATRKSLSELVDQKEFNINLIKEGKSQGRSTAGPTQQIKIIEKSIVEILNKVFGEAKDFKEPTNAYLDLIYFREAPYFLFANNNTK